MVFNIFVRNQSPAYGQYMQQRFGMNAATRALLAEQGINNFSDLIDLGEDDIDAIVSNIRSPGGTIPNPVRIEYDQLVATYNAWVARPMLVIRIRTSNRIRLHRRQPSVILEMLSLRSMCCI